MEEIERYLLLEPVKSEFLALAAKAGLVILREMHGVQSFENLRHSSCDCRCVCLDLSLAARCSRG